MPIIVDVVNDKRPIKVSTLIKRAGLLLQDEEHIRWTVAELIDWINEAAATLVVMRPGAGARLDSVSLSAGSVQILDSSVVQLLDVVRNVGADGAPGRAVRLAERHLIDSHDPDWHSKPGSSVIKHYLYDDRSPNTFFVYPPALPGTQVQIVYSVLPDEVTEEDDELNLSAEYADAVLNQVMFRCLSKDSEYANGQMALAYQSAFMGMVGSKNNSEESTTPSLKVPA